MSGKAAKVVFEGLPRTASFDDESNPLLGDFRASFDNTTSNGNGEGSRDAPLRDETISTFLGNTIVPPTNKNRTLVLCFDGTGDQFDADNSNIVELFTCLSKGDPERQMVYYQAGIGTYSTGIQMFAGFTKAMDTAIAMNLGRHICDGYEFLMENYRANDRICIFGFSRGAYTARCLAGMIHKVGLLPRGNHEQVRFAYQMYKRPDAAGWNQSNAFKKTFSIDVDIEFLGVWDTVNSVGLIPRRLPFTTSNNIVRTFRHAIALDERRAKFKANTWNRPLQHEATLGITDQKIEKQAKKMAKKKKQDGMKAYEQRYSHIRTEPTDVEEVWFAGCHCDVGGGSVANEMKTNLARISLRWMIRECFRRDSGILFLVEGLRGIGLDPASLYPVVLPRPPPLNPIASALQVQRSSKPPVVNINANNNGEMDDLWDQRTEEEHELLDALSPIYDQLSLKWTWWLLELIPMKHRFQQSNNKWKSAIAWNLGHGRVIPRQNKDGVKVHRSVKIRMETEHEDGTKYVPKAENLKLDKIIWVE